MRDLGLCVLLCLLLVGCNTATPAPATAPVAVETDEPIVTTDTPQPVRSATHTPGPGPDPTSSALQITPLVTTDLVRRANPCPQRPLPLLIVGEYGRVSNEDPTPLNMRRDPSTENRPIARLAVLETFYVLEGPECGAEYVWYRIRRSDGLEGWIAEGDAGVYYVEPFLPG